MDIKKIILYVLVASLGTLIWITWQKDYAPATTQQDTGSSLSAQQKPMTSAKDFAPPSFQLKSAKKDSVSSQLGINGKTTVTDHAAKKEEGMVHIKTDVLELRISTAGGNIVGARLPDYPASITDKETPVKILNDDPDALFIAQGGITEKGNEKLIFTAGKSNYQLEAGQNELAVPLTARTQSGLAITKTYTLNRGQYAVKEVTSVKNEGDKAWDGSFYNQLTRKNVTKKKLFSRSYTGAAISTPQDPYKKVTFKELSKNNLSQKIEGGWIAIQIPYFLSAWIPETQIENHYYSQSFGDGAHGQGNVFILGYVSPEVSLAPGSTVKNKSTIYIGPELEDQLKAAARGLDLTINYGWLWFLSKPIFWLMSFIHSVVGNWGWSIILVTLLIKILFYPLSAKSYKSMAKMREVTPRLQALRERYADDKQALGKATMEFYKREKVSPAGGCLPMLIQIPVFIALYYVLIESVQLRQAPFIFWVHDLSTKDPYYVLPILMGLSMLLQQKLSPPPPDPTQAKMMMFLPVVFTIFFLSFPAGLVLYWLTNNCLSVTQQWYIMKSYDPKAGKKYKKK